MAVAGQEVQPGVVGRHVLRMALHHVPGQVEHRAVVAHQLGSGDARIVDGGVPGEEGALALRLQREQRRPRVVGRALVQWQQAVVEGCVDEGAHRAGRVSGGVAAFGVPVQHSLQGVAGGQVGQRRLLGRREELVGRELPDPGAAVGPEAAPCDLDLEQLESLLGGRERGLGGWCARRGRGPVLLGAPGRLGSDGGGFGRGVEVGSQPPQQRCEGDTDEGSGAAAPHDRAGCGHGPSFHDRTSTVARPFTADGVGS